MGSYLSRDRKQRVVAGANRVCKPVGLLVDQAADSNFRCRCHSEVFVARFGNFGRGDSIFEQKLIHETSANICFEGGLAKGPITLHLCSFHFI